MPINLAFVRFGRLWEQFLPARTARKGLGDGYLVNAGSVNTKEQITEMKAAGCDAFTIGSAAFDGSFSPLKGLLRSQLKDILEVDR